jgi:two-component system alkaline phosphatase synthesis response regulator PhoP
MLSARGEEVDRVLGLEFGADDYVTKPFSPRELVSRAKAVLRRAAARPSDDAPIAVGSLRIDARARHVTVADRPVRLTSSEYDILLLLAKRAGAALSREMILSALVDHAPLADVRSIDAHIHNIREKLELDPKNPAHLVTVRGYGYRLEDG